MRRFTLRVVSKAVSSRFTSLMIDGRYQNRGYGSQALQLILEELRKEGHYDHVELCVKKADAEAIRLYEKHGFTDSGYVDEDVPDSLNMICSLSGKDS